MRLVRTAELETVRTIPRKLPERLPFPIKLGEPDWGKIGWEHFENLDVNKVIWERWAPPMLNRYLSLRYLEELGRKEFSYDVDHLVSMTDEELVRLDDEIKKMSYTLANKQADEMEKERELQVLLRGASGALKIGGGVLAVVGAVGAVFAVVATEGLAAPIIVGTAVALTTAFAASDVVEGVGDVKAAVTKEGLDKRSYNPIRDDVFGGNELAYALTGTGISLVTDIVTGAVIAKIPERISASMAAKSAKRAAKKAAQDAAKAVRAAEKAEQATKVVKVAKMAETVEKTEEAAKAVSAAERFYGELDALKLKAREIPHTLTAEEVRACEAVKLQMKGGLSAAGEVSVEEIEKIDEAVKAANVYKESKEFVGAKKETEFIVKTFDLDELTRSQRKAVELADNIITDHLKESDFFAALGDLQGNPIPKPNGGFWNHAQELRDSYTGLIRSHKTLQGSLQNPNLTLKVRRFLEYKLVVISDYANRIEILFAPYGGIT